MMLIEETAVLLSALPVTELKAQLKLGTGFSDDNVQDPVLESFLRAAMAAIEARTGKILVERQFSWMLNTWRDAQAQALPVAPISSLTSVSFVTASGASEVIEPKAYRLEPDAHRPKIKPVGAYLPDVPTGGQVEIGFVAGYGPAWGDLPADLGQAVLLLAAHYYEYRHETTLGKGCMPFGVTTLIERYRTVRLLGGGAS